MKTNTIKRFITIAAAVAITFAIGAGSVYAQGGPLVPNGSDNGNGTITDGGLVWLKNANCFGTQNWQTAMNSAAGLQSGSCGLTDKSTAGQWRLPTKEELQRRQQNKSGFNNVQANYYWSSSSYSFYTDYAWFVGMGYGGMFGYGKSYSFYVWPVRAGQ